MIRAIEMDSRALNARLWALERAIKCGRGYYRVLKEYANDGDFDLDLVVAEIANQGAVYLDPYSSKADASDAEWAFITDDLPHQEFFRRFPDSKLSDPGIFETLGNQYKAWITDKMVRVAEYFYREYEQRTLVYTDTDEPGMGPVEGWLDELPEDMQAALSDPDRPLEGLKTREVTLPKVSHCFITAAEVLERADWQGRYIPIVRVCGKRYNVDGEWSYQGVIFKAKDAQRSYNYMRSAQVEAVGLAPRANYIVDPKQITGFKQVWETANTHNWAYLPAHAFNEEGKPYPQIQRVFAEPELQGITLAVREAETDIKAVTGRSDPSLGVYSKDRSGKAIEQLKMQGELGSSNYLESLADSINYEARILLDLLKYVYDRKGRIVRLLGDENDEKLAMLGQNFMRDKGGIPQPAQGGGPGGPPMPPGMAPGMMPGGPPPGMGGPPPGMPPGMMPPPNGGGMPPGMPMPPPNGGGGPPMMPPGPPPGMPMPMGGSPGGPAPMPPPGMPGQGPSPAPMPQAPEGFPLPIMPPKPLTPAQPEYYDLKEGDYSVVITVGPSYATQHEADQEMFAELFKAMPAFAQVLGDLYLAQRDSPAAQKAAERLRKMNPHAQDDEGVPPIPPQVQAQLQQLQMENQQLKQLADDNIVKQKKIEADMQMKQLDLQAKHAIESIKSQIEMEKMRGTNESKEKIAQLQAETDLIERQMQIRHDQKMAELEFVKQDREAEHEERAAERDDQYAQKAEERTAIREHIGAMRDAHIDDRKAERDDSIAARGERRAENAEEFASRREKQFEDHTARRDAGFEAGEATRGRAHETVENERERRSSSRESEASRKHESTEAGRQRKHDSQEAARNRRAVTKAPRPPKR